MYLKDYIPNIEKKFRKIFFSGISFDSLNVKKNHIFFAIKGNKIDGNNFIPTAIKKGSKIIITEKKVTKIHKGVLYIQTKNIRKLLAEVSSKIYKKKPKNLIAVTGTNGNSTTCKIIEHILKKNRKEVQVGGNIGKPILLEQRTEETAQFII